jgi:4-diphosphocytidyl-2-C-methyl-D-erythritol kinase
MLRELRHLPAPAKLNLFLHVTGRRADGYHLLETVFQLIDLSDRVDLSRRDDGEIELIDPIAGVPPDQDLTIRAARLLAQETGCRLGVRIGLRKRIPMGGGLGGGSSDAATVLLGLNRLWGLSLDRRTLMRIALKLGADVPFFIFGRTAYATGVGERLRPCAQPQRHFVVLAPPVAVATASVFAAPELTRDTKPLTIAGLSRGDRVFSGRNDLEPVVMASRHEVRQSHRIFREVAEQQGAKASLVRMTGSGSCLFLPVDDAHCAHGIGQSVQLQRPAGAVGVWVVSSVEKHPLSDWAFSARRDTGSG